MALALLGVRLLLALVFAAAAFGKFRDRRRFSQSLADFGVRGAAVPTGATLVPALEALTAALLLPAGSAWWGSAMGVALLGVFSVAIGVNMSQGRTPDCACFGAATTEPVGPPALVRNGVLVALTLFVLLAGPGSGFLSIDSAWTDSAPGERILAAALLAALVGLAVLSLHASRLRASSRRLADRVATLERQIRATAAAAAVQAQAQDLGAGGLPPGSVAPPFELPRLEGDRSSLPSLSESGRPVALIFLSAHCAVCQELWPDIERWQSRHADQVTVAAICSGSDQSIEVKLMGRSVANVLLEGDGHVAEAYALSLRPSAVIVSNGIIDSRSVAGVGAVRALITERLEPSHQS